MHRSQLFVFKKSAQVFAMASQSVSDDLSFPERIGFNSTTNTGPLAAPKMQGSGVTAGGSYRNSGDQGSKSPAFSEEI